MLIERILVALEEAPDERFVHDRDGLRRLVVGGGEVAAADELHAEVLEVVRADAIPRRAGLLAGLRRRMAGDEHELAPVVGERVVEREPGALHAGQAIEPLLDVAIERRELLRRVGRRRPVQRDQDASLESRSRSPGFRGCRGCARASSIRRRARPTAVACTTSSALRANDE